MLPNSSYTADSIALTKSLLIAVQWLFRAGLALSVIASDDTSPKGRGFGIPQRFACVLLAAVVAVAPKGRGFS